MLFKVDKKRGDSRYGHPCVTRVDCLRVVWTHGFIAAVTVLSYYCVGEIIGEDADISVWEFGMMGGDEGDTEVRPNAPPPFA
jgi:hypothetical protein